MDDATFDGLMAEMDTAAAPAEASAEAAAPEEVAAPVESAPVESVPAPEPAAPATESLAAAAVPSAPESAQPTPPEPQVPAWDSPENPYFQEAQQFQQLRAMAAEAQRARALEQTQAVIEELADGDIDRMQKITNLLATTAGPLRQEVTQLSGRTNLAEKATTALLIAAQHHLEPAQYDALFGEFQALMNVEGPETMEYVAKSRKQAPAKLQQELSAREQRIKELELQLAARAVGQQRDASGADRVDAGMSGQAPTTWYDRAAAAKTEDDYFDALFSAAS